MKNIIIAFDSMQQSRGVMEFARRLNEASPITITGIFLPPVNFDSIWSYNAGGESAAVFMPTITASNSAVIQRNIVQHLGKRAEIGHSCERVIRTVKSFAILQQKLCIGRDQGSSRAGIHSTSLTIAKDVFIF